MPRTSYSAGLKAGASSAQYRGMKPAASARDPGVTEGRLYTGALYTSPRSLRRPPLSLRGEGVAATAVRTEIAGFDGQRGYF